jgi:hypothetical protein
MSTPYFPPELSGFERFFIRSASNIKPWMFGIAISLLLPFLQMTVQIPLIPVVTVAFIWLGTSLQHYVSMKYVFLPEAAPRDIPPGKFTRILAQLGETVESLGWLGFEEIDRFYLKRNHNIVVIFYKHREKNIYWSLISFAGRLTYSEVSSVFDNNLMLNTVSIDIGHLPKPPSYYAQSFSNSDHRNLLAAHQDGCEVLAEYGYLPHAIPLNILRDDFTRVDRMVMAHLFTKFLWPFRINLWLLLQAGRKHRKPLREQFRLGTAQLPQRV